MRIAFVVTLLLCGTFLVALPPLSDYFYSRELVTIVLAHHGTASVTLDGKMGDIYRFGCWLLGGGMVVLAMVAAFVLPQTERRPVTADVERIGPSTSTATIA